MNPEVSKPISNKKWAAPFFTIWTGQAFSLLGSQLVQFALIWWLTKTTGSATVLATASLVGMLPQVLLSPFAGALVDRHNRRVIMILADGTIALVTLVLAGLFATGLVQIWHIYLILLIRSMAGNFHWPAMQASTSLMVPKEHLSRVQGINQVLNGGMNIVSAPLGALLLEILTIQSVLAIDVGTAMIAILPLFFIAVPQPERHDLPADANGKSTAWQDFVSGLRYVRAWPGLMLIMGMATVINLVLNPAFALMPLLVTRHFGGEAIHLASLQSFFGVGVIAGGLLLSVWGGFRRRILTSLLGLIAMGLGSLFAGLMPPSAFALSVFAFFVVGLGMPITNGPLFAVLQSAVAPEMQGRVFTLVTSVAAAMSPLGLIIAGPVADTLGVQTWFIVGGVVTALMGVAGFFIPAILTIEHGRGDNSEEAVENSAQLAPSPGD